MNDVDNLLKEGIAAVKAGQSTRARALLQRVLRQRPSDASAWLWLSGSVETDDERRECLEKVLEIDPDNPHAKKGLQKLPPRVTLSQEIPVPVQIAAEKPSTPSPVATEKPPASPSLSVEKHRRLLEEEIKWYTSRGWQVVFQSGTAIQLRKGKELKYVTVEQIEQRIAEAQAKASPGVAQRTKKRKKRLKRKLSGWQMAAAVVVLILLCGCLFALFLAIGTSTPANISPPKTPTLDVGSAVGAHLICQEFAEDQLVAPHTAVWPSYSEVKVYKIKDKTTWWQVYGYVDAQNRMGAFLRLNYVCLVDYKGSDGMYDNWELIELEFDE